MAGILKKAKENLDKDISAIKNNKKIKVDKDALKKRIDAANTQKTEELKSLKSEHSTQKTASSEYHARVRLFIISGSKREEIADLGAFFGHKEGKQTLQVINKDKEVIFEEIKPDWQNSFNYSDEATLKTKIKDIKDVLNKFQNGEIQEKKDDNTAMVYYEEDYIAMLRIAEQKYTIKVLGNEGTYSETVDGLEVYSFDIIGFFKIPMFYYTSKSILGIPPAPKIVTGQYLLDVLYKDYKSDETKAERIVMALAMIGALVMILAGVFMLWKTANMLNLYGMNFAIATDNLAHLLNYSSDLNGIKEGINITNNLLSHQIDLPTQDLTQIIE